MHTYRKSGERDDDDDRYEQGLRQSIIAEISNARDRNIEHIAQRTYLITRLN